MRRVWMLLALSLLAVACRREAPRPPPATVVPSAAPVASATTSVPSAALAGPAPCSHHRAFGELDKKAPVALPEPYASFTACDVLEAIFGDYERSSEKSTSAGGTVRLDAVRRWVTHGRTLLAITFYQGEDADAGFICGQCRVLPRIAVVERRGPKLALVGKRIDLWHPAPDVIALFNGRAEFDGARYELARDDQLLGVRTPWSTGMPGVWTQLAFIRLSGETTSIVFEQQVDWAASGMGTEDDDEVSSAVSMEPRPDGPNDLVLETTELRCRQDFSTPQPTVQCKQPQKLGKQRWRFDGTAFERIEGKDAPLPKVLKKLWGW